MRNDQRRQAFRMTASTQNYVVERFWPEVNGRKNYRVKRAIIRLIEEEEIDLDDQMFRYCLSRTVLYVEQDAVQHFMKSWNW